MNWLVVAVLILSVGLTGSRADELTEAAYCSGAIQINIDLSRQSFGTAVDLREDQQNLELKNALVANAIQRRKLSIEAANSFAAVGQKDARLCWEYAAKCVSQTIDAVKNKTPNPSCSGPGNAVCERVSACK